MRNYANLKFTFCGILLLTMTGCSSISREQSLDAFTVNKETEIVRDDFKKIIFYRGPLVSNTVDNKSDAPEVEEIRLHARTDQDHTTRYFLSVTDYYDGDWRGFDQAFDLVGSKFHAIAVRHKVDCLLFCEYDEELDIEVTHEYLVDHLQSGITMRLYGPSDVASAPFTLTAAYIEGFLNGTNSY